MARGKKVLWVAVAGCANAGKSTLVNALRKRPGALVSGMAQTTRVAVPYPLDLPEAKLWLWDAPGLLEPKSELDGFLRREAVRSLGRADACLLVVSAAEPYGPLLDGVCAAVRKHRDMPVFLVLTKVDKPGAKENAEALKAEITKRVSPAAVFGANLREGAPDGLLDAVLGAPPRRGPEDEDEYADPRDPGDDDAFIVSEAVRGAIIANTRDELPHAAAVVVEKKAYDRGKNAFTAECAIVVEKDGQKAIIIGRGGSMVKRIGIAARRALGEVYDCAVHLKLFCRVERNWRDSEHHVKALGHRPWR